MCVIILQRRRFAKARRPGAEEERSCDSYPRVPTCWPWRPSSRPQLRKPSSPVGPTARLRQWWPHDADIDPRAGGAYLLAWPAQDWRLRGVYTLYAPPRALAFTWRWDHEPDARLRLVMLQIDPAHAGARLTLWHAPYALDAGDQAVRLEQHLAGWAHFLPRLEALLAAP